MSSHHTDLANNFLRTYAEGVILLPEAHRRFMDLYKGKSEAFARLVNESPVYREFINILSGKGSEKREDPQRLECYVVYKRLRNFLSMIGIKVENLKQGDPAYDLVKNLSEEGNANKFAYDIFLDAAIPHVDHLHDRLQTAGVAANGISAKPISRSELEKKISAALERAGNYIPVGSFSMQNLVETYEQDPQIKVYIDFISEANPYKRSDVRHIIAELYDSSADRSASLSDKLKSKSQEQKDDLLVGEFSGSGTTLNEKLRYLHAALRLQTLKEGSQYVLLGQERFNKRLIYDAAKTQLKDHEGFKDITAMLKDDSKKTDEFKKSVISLLKRTEAKDGIRVALEASPENKIRFAWMADSFTYFDRKTHGKRNWLDLSDGYRDPKGKYRLFMLDLIDSVEDHTRQNKIWEFFFATKKAENESFPQNSEFPNIYGLFEYAGKPKPVETAPAPVIVLPKPAPAVVTPAHTTPTTTPPKPIPVRVPEVVAARPTLEAALKDREIVTIDLKGRKLRLEVGVRLKEGMPEYYVKELV